MKANVLRNNDYSTLNTISEKRRLLDGENGLILAESDSRPLLCTGNGFGRSAMFGVCGAGPPRFDKIDFRISFECELAGVAVRLSSDDFWISVFGVAGVSNSRNARTLR